MRRTKIVCTIGPASNSAEVLERLILNGMNVARLNFSHGTQEEHGAVIKTIREVSKKTGRPVAILQDLAGPKIRIGEIKAGYITLAPDSEYILTNRQVDGDEYQATLTYPNLPKEVHAGDRLLLSDGALELNVIDTDGTDIRCRTVIGGRLSSHKGINLPSRSIKAPILSKKDKSDLAFGISQGVDYVAVSFVRSVDDVNAVKHFMHEQKTDIPLIAKIEKHEAVTHMDDIIAAVDGIMVARGDLSVEIPMEKVPHIQKKLIDKTNRAGKPVITATQMMFSMVNNPRPTRAEVADVANAVLDGTDALMLSEETAMGKYPVETVSFMSRIAEEADDGFPFDQWHPEITDDKEMVVSDAVADAACDLANDIKAGAVITCTVTGMTAWLVAKYRPAQAQILAPTPSKTTYDRLSLIWGVEPLLISDAEKDEENICKDRIINRAVEAVRNSGIAYRGRAVITAGLPDAGRGSTNTIKVVEV